MTASLAPPAAAGPAGRAAGDGGPAPDSALRVAQRMRLLAASLALVVLSFVQAPGRIVSDTKLDLAVDPVHFLARAFHLWEPLGASGQLQNQAYGYFLPMGPFFALGELLGLPAWVVQRLWWAVIFLVAFHGLHRVCAALRVGTPNTRLLAAFAFALSPRMITEIGAISIEAWPGAVAPWVLLPLLRVRPGGERRAAARSGLAVALMGGVNAVAVGAVLPIPVWWLMTRKPGPVRRRLSGWWTAAAFCGIAWWLIPLILLGRYSPPFLDWIESSAVSTSKASLPGALQGTTHWISWFQLPTAIWPAGWAVLTSPPGVLLSWLLVALAVIGLLLASMPHRTFLIGVAVGGLVLLTLGHTGPFSAPWADVVQNFLDGAGAPLRNTHKFDVLVRLPLAVGLAHALQVLSVPSVRSIRGSRLLAFVASCAVIGSAAPALIGQLPPKGTFREIPGYWGETARWLAAHPDGGRALVVPGANFPTSLWGSTHDEPLQPLARTPWAVRDGVPLSSAGNIRMLTTIEQQLSTGRGSPGLAAYLARSGITRLVVRADLVRDASSSDGDTPRPVTVQASLAASPGLSKVAAFGPKLGGRFSPDLVADYGLDPAVDAVQVWEIGDGRPLAEVTPASSVVRVAGGPESLLALEDTGVLAGRVTVLDGDPQAQALQTGPLVVTDTPQRREAAFSTVRDVYSPVMTATQPWVADRRVHDWLPFEAPQVTAAYGGISGYRQSAAASSAQTAWYAVDDDRSSAWTSTTLSAGQWIEIRLAPRVRLGADLTLTGSPGTARPRIVLVTTDAGSRRTTLPADPVGRPSAHAIAVPAGESSRLRITVESVQPGPDALLPASISDLRIPGVTPTRTLVLPDVGQDVPTTSPQPASVISLRTERGGEDGCVDVFRRAWCADVLARPAEDGDIDRLLNLPAAASYEITATARARATTGWDEVLAPAAGGVKVTVTSRRGNEPAERPAAAVDGDDDTAWVAAAWDTHPTVDLSWPSTRRFDRLTWHVDEQLAVSRPLRIRLEAGGVSRDVAVGEDGTARFPAVAATSLHLTVTESEPVQTRDPRSGIPATLPVGASEIEVPSLKALTPQVPAARPVELACGDGPVLTVAGRRMQTRVTGTVAQVLARTPMTVTPCASSPASSTGPASSAPVSLPGGRSAVRLAATALVQPQDLVFRATGGAALPGIGTGIGTGTGTGTGGSGPVTPLALRTVDAEHRTVEVAAASAAQVVVVHENANPGWQATLDGERLKPVRIDGWQQAWIVPAGAGGVVDLRFPVDGVYRASLFGGLALVLVLALLSLPDPGSGRRQRVEAPVPLVAVRRRWVYGALGGGVMVFVGGLWGLAALAVAVLLLRRVSGWVVAGAACAVMGVAAVPRVAEADSVWLASVGTLAGLLTTAVLVLRIDADHDGALFTRVDRFTEPWVRRSAAGLRRLRSGLRTRSAPSRGVRSRR